MPAAPTVNGFNHKDDGIDLLMVVVVVGVALNPDSRGIWQGCRDGHCWVAPLRWPLPLRLRCRGWDRKRDLKRDLKWGRRPRTPSALRRR